MISHITPKWKIDEFKSLDYVLTTYKSDEHIDNYVNVGHSRNSISLFNYHEPNPMPDVVFDYVKPHFNFLDNVCMAINYFKPGQYLPLHVDIFGRYIEVNNVDFSRIVRYIVFLEDNSPGQILQIGKNCVSDWNSGDCFMWLSNEPHAFYNMSMMDRYAIQVTGTLK